MLAGPGPLAVRIAAEGLSVSGLGVSAGGAQAAFAPLASLDPVAGFVGDAGASKWAHDAKAFERTVLRGGAQVAGVSFDTLLAGYLLDPASADYPLQALCERYLGADVLGDRRGRGRGPALRERRPGARWRPKPRRWRSWRP